VDGPPGVAPATTARAASPGDRFALLVLSFGGLGFLPLVPGSFGTLGGVAVALLLPGSDAGRWLLAVGLAVLAASVLTVALGPAASRAAGRADPPSVVMDEVAGYLVTLAASPAPGPLEIGVAYLLFRAADLLKPWPARALERLPGGWGILLDDLAAGAWALLALQGLGWVVLLR